MAIPFIAAYKAGAQTVNNYITDERIVYWYRQNLKTLDCSATDTCMVPANNDSGNYFIGVPNGWQDMADSVFVVSLLKEAGSLTINSGSNQQVVDAPAGAALFEVPLGLGQQSFILSRNGSPVSNMAGASLKDVTDVCNCGCTSLSLSFPLFPFALDTLRPSHTCADAGLQVYNFNAFVGALPADSPDPLGGDGITSLTTGLHVSTCSATASLPSSPAPITAGSGNAPRAALAAPTPAF